MGHNFPPVMNRTDCVINVVKVTFSILQDHIFNDLEVIVGVVCRLHASAALTTLGGQAAECCMTCSVILGVESSCSLVL